MPAIAPGKLILAGEYAAIYGYPALAIAVDRYMQAVIDSYHEAGIVQLNLLGTRQTIYYKLSELPALYEKLRLKYAQFIQQALPVNQILSAPYELILFTLAILVEHFSLAPKEGLTINLNSSIPLGCGMGSSAAMALTILSAGARYFNLNLTKPDYYHLALEAEKLQHGYPSGLDIQASLYGGGWLLHNKKVQPFSLPNFPLFCVNTGRPSVSTGDCVSAVTQQFKAENPIWQKFAVLTKQIMACLTVNDVITQLKPLIQKHHRLLTSLGVVPIKVQQFITAVERCGAAAKICGAGAVEGEQAGMVWLVAENLEELFPICRQFDYVLQTVNGELKGLHAID